MPHADNPGSQTLKSVESMIQTPDRDTIVAGGPSSSELLNDFRDKTILDLVEGHNHSEEIGAKISLANQVFGTTLTALSSMISSVFMRTSAASGRWLADFFSTEFVHGSNGAQIDTVYGQATLPILTSQEKLVGLDSRDQVWIPKGAAIEYSYVPGTPNEVDWLRDDKHVFALHQDPESAWWRNRETSGVVWLRVRVPANLNANKFANAICLHPYPPFHTDLLSVEYQNPAGVYTSADLSYLRGWSTTDSRVKNFDNVRIFIPQSQVTELRIKISTPGVWGFQKISLKQLEFSPNATLAVNFASYSPNGINRVNIFGKDQSALSYLTTGINGDIVTVAMTQNTTNATPVITGIEARK